MIRHASPLVVVVALLAACGASAREKALRTTYTATAAAQAGFVAWDDETQLAIVEAATSEADGLTKLAAHKARREAAVTAFAAVYQALAAAAIVDDDPKSLSAALSAYARLKDALAIATGGKLP